MTDSVVEKSGYLHNQCQEACFFHYSKKIEIMETEYVELYEGEYLDAALKRKYGDKNIPTNVILDKTLTGIGATYTELHSCRNSIIIEPNVPVIIDKAKKHSDWLTVYSATTVPQIKKYLNDTKIRYKKILTTPEGFKKIRKAADKGYKQIQSDYFCLFDECEKITQDCDYRGAITQPVYDFFEFENKAFVSATPLEVRHPKFEEQGFKKIKIAPQFDYKKNLHLIVTNSYEKTVREELEKLKDSPCVCIFLNSVTGINGLVNSFKIMDESYIFCSEDGVKKLKDDGFTNALSEICYPLRRYNLFTSRFYSAIDINLDVKPDVLILTNLNQADYTKIDPFTEAIQIQGRFRVKFEDGQTYNSLTHITNTKDLKALSDKEVTDMIDEYVATYKHLMERFEAATDSVRKKGIADQLKRICEDYLLDDRGNIDYFGIDNKYNEERVKGYYLSDETIHLAYDGTGFFNVAYDGRIESVGKDDVFRLKNGKSEVAKVRHLKYLLEKLDRNKGIEQRDKELIIEELKKTFDLADKTIEAYNELTPIQFDMITTLPYISPVPKQAGDKERKYDMEKIFERALKDKRNEDNRFSVPVLQDIDAAFGKFVGQKIAKDETKRIIGEIYDKHYILHNETDITAKLNQDTIKDYYDVTPHNKEKPNKWLIKGMKPELVKLLDKEQEQK